MIENPCLFAVGVPRSGTTLLQRMLDHHGQLAVANDTHFIPRVLEKTNRQNIRNAELGQEIPLEPAHVEATIRYHRFRRLGLTDDDVVHAGRSANTYAQFVSLLYDRFAKSQGKAMSGEKTPDYVRRLPLLSSLFPNAKFLHIIRDGRDVALSLLNWAHATKGPGKIELWEQQPLAVCALWWEWLIRQGRTAAKQWPMESYLELNYETLIDKPVNAMCEVTAWLRIDFDPHMTEFHRGKAKRDAHLSAKSAWLSPQKGLRNWRRDMTDSQIELFEALAGDTLAELGYARQCTDISNPTERLARRCRAWWRENFWIKCPNHQPVRTPS